MNHLASFLSRRAALKNAASGFGFLAFSALATAEAEKHSANHPTQADGTHFPAKAKRVIFLCMNGGPSHVDLLDYKPELNKRSGQPLSKNGGAKLLGSPFEFSQHGDAGHWISELLPHTAKHADDLCVIHSMQTDLPNHSQAFTQMHTGSFQFERPSMGAWTLYGLGTLNENLPGFITLNPPSDNGGAKNYGSSFLPASCQGTRIGTNQIPRFYAKMLGVDKEPGPPLRNIRNEKMTRQEQREQLNLLRDLNQEKQNRDGNAGEIEGAIAAYELAFRMQREIPDVMDTSAETKEILDAYGIGNGKPTDRFGQQCLMARRMAEAGVRFIELTSPVGWDHHFRLQETLPDSTIATDQPVAALLADLKNRDMLKDTLVIWAGEFGRTPYAQSLNGRDHNNKGFTLWMAGGGVKSGHRVGATDEYGAKAVDNPVSIHDWHATILHLLGLDHKRLTFDYAGRSYRLTDVHGRVINDIFA